MLFTDTHIELTSHIHFTSFSKANNMNEIFRIFNFLEGLFHSNLNVIHQPTETPLPQKPPRKRHPSFDLQALLAPRRGTASPKLVESPVGPPNRNSPLAWRGRRTLADPVIATGMAAAFPGWGSATGVGGGVLIRGVEVSSKEVVDHTGSPRQHVLLSRTERETGTERGATTPQRFVIE